MPSLQRQSETLPDSRRWEGSDLCFKEQLGLTAMAKDAPIIETHFRGEPEISSLLQIELAIYAA